jgi:uncharacterized protein
MPAGPATRHAVLQLSLFVRSADTFRGRALYHEIVDRARLAGLRGATAIRGVEGFGATARLRAPGRLGALTGDEPVLIEITDDARKILAFLPAVESLPGTGLIVLRELTAVRRAAPDVPDIAASPVT